MTKAFVVGHGAPKDDPHGEPVVLEPWALPRSANPAGGLIASLTTSCATRASTSVTGPANGIRVLSSERACGGCRRRSGREAVPALLDVEGVGVNWMLWSRGGVRIVSHPGGTNGQQSAFSLVPERGFAVTVLTNAELGAMLGFEATDWALERFLGLPRPALTTVPARPAQLAEYSGEYVLPVSSETIRIRQEDGALHLGSSQWLVAGQPRDRVAAALRR